MNTSTNTRSEQEWLRSPLVFLTSSVVFAVILGLPASLWSYLPRHLTTTLSVPFAVTTLTTGILMSIRSRLALRSLVAAALVIGAMTVDLIAPVGYRGGLLSGIVLAQIGLFAAARLPPLVRPEKMVLWVLATVVQSVWLYNAATVGKHISFFGPTMVR